MAEIGNTAYHFKEKKPINNCRNDRANVSELIFFCLVFIKTL